MEKPALIRVWPHSVRGLDTPYKGRKEERGKGKQGVFR